MCLEALLSPRIASRHPFHIRTLLILQHSSRLGAPFALPNKSWNGLIYRVPRNCHPVVHFRNDCMLGAAEGLCWPAATSQYLTLASDLLTFMAIAKLGRFQLWD